MFTLTSFPDLLTCFSISGRITDHRGQPVAGVPVTLGGTVIITKLTSRDGAYSFTGLPCWGRYRVVAPPHWSGSDGRPCAAEPGWHDFAKLGSDRRADFSYGPPEI